VTRGAETPASARLCRVATGMADNAFDVRD
jgi:hypothetical protein